MFPPRVTALHLGQGRVRPAAGRRAALFVRPLPQSLNNIISNTVHKHNIETLGALYNIDMI